MALHPRSSQDSTHGTVQRVIDLLQCSHVPQSRHQRCIVSAGHSNKDLDSAASDCVSFSKEPRCWQPPTSAALMRCDAVQSQGSGYRRRRGSANSLVLDASRSRVATTAHEDYRFMTRWLTAVGWRRWNDETWRFQWTLLACSRARTRGTVGYDGSRAGNHLQPHALPCLVVRHQHHRDPRYRRSLLRCDDSSAIRSSCVLQVEWTSPNFTIHKFPFVHLQHVLHGDCRLPCWPPDDYYGGSVNHQSFSLRQPFVRFNFKCGTQRCAVHRGRINPESAAKR